MTKMVIHPGFAKSGSTTLQDILLERSEEIGCFAKPLSSGSEDFLLEMYKPEGLYDNNKTMKILSNLRNINSDKSVFIISAESFSHLVYTKKTIAKRLYDAFPDADIFFTIRNQVSSMMSVYSTIGHMLDAPTPYRGRYIDRDSWLSYQFEQHPFSHLSEFEYIETINYYEELFGKDRITVLLFEEFVHDRSVWADKLSKIIELPAQTIVDRLDGAHSYASPKLDELTYRRLRSFLSPPGFKLNWVPGSLGVRTLIKRVINLTINSDAHFTSEESAEIRKHFASGNRQLADRYELDLEKYNYPL